MQDAMGYRSSAPAGTSGRPQIDLGDLIESQRFGRFAAILMAWASITMFIEGFEMQLVGYAAPAGAETRRGVDGIGRDVPRGDAAETRLNGINGTTGKQQDQLHLMSRRDPRTWRPPA